MLWPEMFLNAINENDIETVRKLISQGADPNLREYANRTAQETGISLKVTATVGNKVYSYTPHPMVVALRNKSYAVAELLLKAGADKDFKSVPDFMPVADYLHSPFYECIKRENIDLTGIRTLVTHGVDPDLDCVFPKMVDPKKALFSGLHINFPRLVLARR